MLFNSYIFILAYLPVTLAGFFLLARESHRLAALWLTAASLFFYGWWDPSFVLLVMLSITFNYAFGYAIGHTRGASAQRAKYLLTAAVAANLALLAYFKYANFFVASAGHLLGLEWLPLDIILPIGISFFTFTQIAFLVDVYRGLAREYNFIHYVLFVTYFPHLIAGPVLHHKQMMPQFGHAETYRLNRRNLEVGLTIFIIGLAKKVLLADQFALYATPVFDVAAQGASPRLFEAWIGALAYALQLYFDFSGYSDMAIGLSRMFNIRLPLNFASPYKAPNIIEFWRRWHMTLSAFLRDYLYVPLGGNRQGRWRRHLNLMLTMLLGGLWHGAGWTFILWGGLHGIFLVGNHAWRRLSGGRECRAGWCWIAGTGLTFFAVVVAWVPFRAPDIDTTLRLWAGMAGLNGISLSPAAAAWLPAAAAGLFVFDGPSPLAALKIGEVLAVLSLGLAVVWGLPNTQQWMAAHAPAWDAVRAPTARAWQPTRLNGLLAGSLFALSLLLLTRESAFLYFQF